MEIYLIGLAVALVGGLLMSRLTRLLHLPAVTAYLVAGLLLGPFFLGRLNVPGLGFNTLEEVNVLSIVSQTALGFIAFAMGNEFRLSQLRTIGSRAIIIGILQAVITTIVVDVILLLLHLFFPHIISVPCAITLGAIAAATAPAATLMVVRQYKADGPMTRLLMLVVALDDAVGLLLFSVSFGIATALSNGQVSVLAVVVEPIVEILLSVGLGGFMGLLLHWVERFFHSRSKRMVRVWSDIQNAGHQLIVVSSAATGLGAGKLQIEKPGDLVTKQAAAAVGQCELMYTYDRLFGQYNHTVAQMLLTWEDFDHENRLHNLQNTLERLLQLHAIPIINENDPVACEEYSLGDNDTLAALVAKCIHADLVVLMSDIDGLYTADPHTHSSLFQQARMAG